MIDALIHGRLVHCRLDGVHLVGRIVIEDDKPIQFTARRGTVKAAIQAMACGMPISAAGQLSTSVQRDKTGTPYVCHELAISAVLSAQPQPKGLLGSLL